MESVDSILNMACMTVMSLSASPPTLDKSGHRLCTSHRVKPKILRILNGKSHYIENDHVNSKSGVNFQVKLKQNCTSGNHVKPDLPFWPYSATVSEIDHIFHALLCVIIQVYKIVL